MSDSDPALIERLKQGDKDALVEFIESRRPQLLAFIRKNLSDALGRKVEPQDLLQDVSLNAVDSLNEIELGDRDPFNWLCRIAERRIIDAHRRYFGAQKRSANREVGMGSPSTDTRPGGIIDLLVVSMTSPSRAFSRNQKEFVLKQAIDSLPQQHRDALRMRYVDGLPSKEIAQQLGKSDASIRVMLTRTLKRLQEILSDDPHFQSESFS